MVWEGRGFSKVIVFRSHILVLPKILDSSRKSKQEMNFWRQILSKQLHGSIDKSGTRLRTEASRQSGFKSAQGHDNNAKIATNHKYKSRRIFWFRQFRSIQLNITVVPRTKSYLPYTYSSSAFQFSCSVFRLQQSWKYLVPERGKQNQRNDSEIRQTNERKRTQVANERSSSCYWMRYCKMHSLVTNANAWLSWGLYSAIIHLSSR